jgi:hypothetical protein
MGFKSKVASVEAAATPTFSKAEKIAAAFSPLIAIIVGYVATLVARFFPGMNINKSELGFVFLLGFAAVIFLVWRLYEAKHKQILHAIGVGLGVPLQFAEHILGEVGGPVAEKAVVDYVENALKDHTAEIDTLLADFTKQLPGLVGPVAAKVIQNLLADVNLGDLLSGKVNLGDVLKNAEAAPATPAAAPLTVAPLTASTSA